MCFSAWLALFAMLISDERCSSKKGLCSPSPDLACSMVRRARVYLSCSASPIQQRVPAGSRVSLLMSSSRGSRFFEPKRLALGMGRSHCHPGIDLISPLHSHPACLLAGKAHGTLHQTQTFGETNRIYSCLLSAAGRVSPWDPPEVRDVVITLTIFMMARMYCSMSRRPWYPTIILSATTRVST